MNSPEIEQLNSLLRGEIASVETYTQALGAIEDEKLLDELESCRSSHLHRAEALRKKIDELGGAPAQGSGAWGTFSKLVEGGAKLAGTGPAVAALEEGEDHGNSDYRRALTKLDEPLKSFVQDLLPEQQKTHQVLSRLKHSVH